MSGQTEKVAALGYCQDARPSRGVTPAQANVTEGIPVPVTPAERPTANYIGGFFLNMPPNPALIASPAFGLTLFPLVESAPDALFALSIVA